MTTWSTMVAFVLVLMWISVFGSGLVGQLRRRLHEDRTPLATLGKVHRRARRDGPEHGDSADDR
jgi:hypothetical protein